MPLYMIERGFAEQLEMSEEDVRLIEEINGDEGVRWLFSFLSADRRRTYCLYEAPSPEAILAAARRADVPADEIVEVGPAVRPRRRARLGRPRPPPFPRPPQRLGRQRRLAGRRHAAAGTRSGGPPG